MFTVILSAAYGLWILWLIIRLRDINRHPKKYDTVKGYEAYRNSIWYWPAKKPYGKGTPPDNCGLACAPIFVLLFVWYFCSTVYRYSAAYYKNSEILAFVGEHVFNVLTWFLLLAYSLAMGAYLTMFSKKPMAVCFSYHAIFRRDDRSEAMRKMTLIVLIMTVIVFPLRIMSVNNRGFADDEKLVYRPFLSILEQTYTYSEVKTEIVYDETGETVQHYYLINPSGQRFDLYANYVTLPDDVKDALKDYVLPYMEAWS